MTTAERELSDEERAQLTSRLANARKESTQSLLKTVGASAAVCGALALLTFLASDAPRVLIAAFWAIHVVYFPVLRKGGEFALCFGDALLR